MLRLEKRPVELEFLSEVIQAQMTTVPFENVSKLYYFQTGGQTSLPSLSQYLDGIENYHFGGTCYANNYYFHLLLKHLGFKIRLCGADMTSPDVHLVSIVDVDVREYIVDVGYAAPFLQPLPRDLPFDHVISWGNDRYVLKPKDEQGCSRLELYRNGELKHGYVVNPTPRSIAHFATVVEDSLSDKATFRNSLLLVRFFPERSLTLFNQTVLEIRGANVKKWRVEKREELPRAVYQYFEIPESITRVSLTALNEFNDAWS
jgi:arylamine N-acetyltransferase